MARNNDEKYDSTLDPISNSAVERRVQRERQKRMAYIIVCALLAAIVLCLLILIIGSAVGRAPSSNEHESDTSVSKDKITFTSVPLTTEDVKRGSLVLSNDTYAYDLPETDASLTNIYVYRQAQHTGTKPYQLAGMSSLMNVEALAAMDRMLTDCAAATGSNDVMLRLGYLTAEEKKVESTIKSCKEHALDYTTGYGIDLTKLNDTTKAWLNDHAAQYGFIIRYPENKIESTGVVGYTNYFRYVGVAHASYMKANDLCLEEYLTLLQQYTSQSRLTVTGVDGHVYEIYHCPVNGNTSVSCPANYPYAISGTNAGGVVITVDRSSASVADTETGTGTADTTAGTTANGVILPSAPADTTSAGS